jgi:dihydroorotase
MPIQEISQGVSAPGTRITIRLPDDFHHHCRDGSQTAAILAHASKRFGRCLIMPNLKPPVVTTEQALQYKQHILKSLPPNTTTTMEPLMTLYLTDQTKPEEIVKAAQAGGIVGCKYYPVGATTNSDMGVTDIRKCYEVLKELDKHKMMLCIHSEVTEGDIFDREPIFIEQVMKPLVRDFPTLKITMEHISTRDAVEYVKAAPDNVKASITCHHLLFNRNRKYNTNCDRSALVLIISIPHLNPHLHYSFP